MRPVKLEMQAFGSYGQKTIVDFTKPTQNIFLISGDTGSGKTTIFDAMVYALYGEASSESNKKDGLELQSHFVTTFVEPYVALEFTELQGNEVVTYTVKRVPKHMKKNNKKSVSEVVTLIMPDGHEYAQKEADAKIEEIVGLNKAQFMQVGMIAQGEFMQMLRASTKEKKAIFQKLFHTEIYAKIVDELARRKKDKETEFAQIRTKCQTEAAHIQVPEGDALKDGMQTMIKELQDEKKFNVVLYEQLVAELSMLCEQLKVQVADLEAEESRTNAVHEACVRATIQAKTLDERYRALDAAKSMLQACEAEEAQVKAQAALAEKIQQAYQILPYAQGYQTAKQLAEKTQQELQEKETQRPALKAAVSSAKASSEEAAALANKQREVYTKVESKVNEAKRLFKQIDEAVRTQSAFQASLQSAKKTQQQASDDFEALERHQKAWKEKIALLEDAGVQLVSWQEKESRADHYDQQLKSLKTQLKRLHDQTQLVQKTQAEYQTVRNTLAPLEADYHTKKQMYLDAQAGYIAAQYLIPGEPCPVCGSTSHPLPCALSDAHREITRELLDTMEHQMQELNQSAEAAASAAGTAQAALEEMQQTWSRDLGRLQDAMNADIPGLKPADDADTAQTLTVLDQANKAWMKTVKEKLVYLREQAEACKALQKQLNQSETEKTELNKALEQARQDYHEADAGLKSATAVLEQLTGQKKYDSLKAADEALAAAAAEKTTAEAAERRGLDALNLAKKALDEAEALIENHQAHLPEYQADREMKHDSYVRMMDEKALSEDEWRKLVDGYKEAVIKDLQESVRNHEARKITAMTKAQEAKDAIGSQERPELQQFEEAEAKAKQKAENVRSTKNTLKRMYEADVQTLNHLNKEKENREKVAKEYTNIVSLWEILAGKKTGARMDLETFVLRYYLERILYNANRRFEHMSAGQYRLKMVDIDKAGDGGNKGLDLMVYSCVTGKERSIRTLSGGESFMAALALALGMADQIQINSSVVNLDVMFIDEGFGSLDDHSRSQAVRVLKDMAGGSKLIGIISHVSELKQEIDDQLIVTKTENGSQLEWKNN